MLISVKGPGTAVCRARTGRRRESSVVHCSSAPALGNHREGRGERSAFTPGTLCKSQLIEVDSLCIKGIWEPDQHYCSLIPLQRSQRRLGRIQKSREQKKHKKHTVLNPSWSKIRWLPASTLQITGGKAHGCILRLRRRPEAPLCPSRGLAPAAVASACLTWQITSRVRK